jgi:Fe-S oxidoreductase
MLFELLQGEVLGKDWHSEHVKEAFDLCLACKACKSECPANVDVATFKAEFLSHYYEKARRPLNAYAFGMIDRWARLASHVPGLINYVNHSPLFSALIRMLLNIPNQREIPKFSDCSFQRWAAKASVSRSADKIGSQPASSSQEQVILWPDTFNNYFHPETARAAVDVLGRAGFKVVVPQQRLCCGRPLYDFGMLDRARQYLLRVMNLLGNEIDAGIPIVILEPSCASVFRDELPNLFPNEPRAARLRKQTFLLSEFLEHHAPGFRPPQLSGKVLLHGHCHHKALMKFRDEEELVRKMGVDLQPLDSGCCGMAGSFGFEKNNYDVSLAIGERVLLPAVRETAVDTLIVSDGFSCREQIFQSTKRKAIHLAELLQLAAARSERQPD